MWQSLGLSRVGRIFSQSPLRVLQRAEFQHANCESQQETRAARATDSYFVQLHFQPDARFPIAMLCLSRNERDKPLTAPSANSLIIRAALSVFTLCNFHDFSSKEKMALLMKTEEKTGEPLTRMFIFIRVTVMSPNN